MIRCEIHGLQFLSQTCSHVRSAAKTGEMVTTHVARDAFGDVVTICPHCLARYGLRIIRMDEDGPVPVCVDCLIKWHAETGQGDWPQRIEKSVI